MRSWITIGLLLSVMVAWTSPVEARTFQIQIEVSIPFDSGGNTKASNRLVLGVHPDATDGYDPQWETPVFFSTPDSETGLRLRAYVDHPEYQADRRQLWRDIRSEKGEKRWDLAVVLAPSQVGKTVTVAWDLPSSLLASNDRVTLSYPDSGVSVNMRSENRYTFIGDSTSPKVLQVSVNPPASSGGGDGGVFGCGSIGFSGGEPPDGNATGSILAALLILFSPLVLSLRRKFPFTLSR